MRKSAALLAISGIISSTAAQAVPDNGLVLHDTGIGIRGGGVGVVAQIRIKLGSDRVVRRSERLQLDLAAGPVTVFPNVRAAGGMTRSAPSLASFKFKPGYSSSFNFAGQAVMVDKGPLHAADKESGEDKQSTGDKVAWVAAVAGGVLVLIGGVLFIKVSNGDFSE